MHFNLASTPKTFLPPLVMLLGLVFVTALTGCANTIPSSAPTEASKPPAPLMSPGFCDNAKPIRWHKNDTDGTLVQIKEHNAVGIRLCNWGKT